MLAAVGLQDAARTLSRVAPIMAIDSDPPLQKSLATDFRFGTGGPVSEWGGAVIGFQG